MRCRELVIAMVCRLGYKPLLSNEISLVDRGLLKNKMKNRINYIRALPMARLNMYCFVKLGYVCVCMYCVSV